MTAITAKKTTCNLLGLILLVASIVFSFRLYEIRDEREMLQIVLAIAFIFAHALGGVMWMYIARQIKF